MQVTVIERELRVGGKAASFEFAGQKYPIGAVGTPLALESASFAESQLFERPWRFLVTLLGRTGRRLKVLNANNLMTRGARWPAPFPKAELVATEPQKPIWFVSHWWGEAIFEFVWCIDQHSKDHTEKDQWGTVINKEAVQTCGYWVCAYGACPSARRCHRRRC